MAVRTRWVLLSYLLSQALTSIQGNGHLSNTLSNSPIFSPFYKQFWEKANLGHKIPQTEVTPVTNSIEHTNLENDDVESHGIIEGDVKIDVFNNTFDVKDVININSEITSLKNTHHDDNIATNVTKPVSNVAQTKNLTLKRLKDFNSIFQNMTRFKDRFDKLKLKHNLQVNSQGLNTEKVNINTDTKDVITKNRNENKDSSILSGDKESNELMLPSNNTYEIENNIDNKIEVEPSKSKIEISSILQTNADSEIKSVSAIAENPIKSQETNVQPKTKPSADFEAILAKIQNFKAFTGNKNHVSMVHNTNSKQNTPDHDIQPQVVLPSQSAVINQSSSGHKNYLSVAHTQPSNKIATPDKVIHPEVILSSQSTTIEPDTNNKSIYEPESRKFFSNISPDIFNKLRQQFLASKAIPKSVPTTETTIAYKSHNITEEAVAIPQIVTTEDRHIVEEYPSSESPSPTLSDEGDNNPVSCFKQIQPLHTHIDHIIEQPKRSPDAADISETLPNVLVDYPKVVEPSNVDQQDSLKEALSALLSNFVNTPKILFSDVEKETSNVPNTEVNDLLIALNKLFKTPTLEHTPHVDATADYKNIHSTSNSISNVAPISTHNTKIVKIAVQNENNGLKQVTTIQDQDITNSPISIFHEFAEIKLPELVALEDHATANQDITRPNHIDNKPIIASEPKSFNIDNIEEVLRPNGVNQCDSPPVPETIYSPTYYPNTIVPRIINIDAILSNLQNKQEKQLNQALEFLLLSDLLNRKFCNPKIVKTLLSLLYLR